MSTHTPGPWRVALTETIHRKGSPACEGTCGRGDIPLRVESYPSEGKWTETECHAMATEWVDDIVAANGDHVVCTGHDYDEGGLIANVYDAHLIAAAPDLLAALKGMVGQFDDPCPYDSATTIAAARAAISRAEGKGQAA